MKFRPILIATCQVAFSIIATCAFLAGIGRAEPLHWWRFEDGAFLEDSVADATISFNDLSIATQVALPDSGRGVDFPIALGQDANAAALDLAGAFPNGPAPFAATGVSDDFTIELFANLQNTASAQIGSVMVWQGSSFSFTPTNFSWSFVARTDGSQGSAPRELFLNTADGSRFHDIRSGLAIEDDRDYYLAAAFDLDGQEVTFYAHDLAENVMYVRTVPHELASLNPDPNFRIGAGGFGRVQGVLDEIRHSSGALGFDELLIQDAVFESSGTNPRAEFGLSPREAYLRGVAEAIDVRGASTVNSDFIAKFALPVIENSADRLESATLRLFISGSRVGDGDLSLFHGLTDNDFELTNSDFDDPLYVDTSLDVLQTGDPVRGFFEVDVTDLVVSDYMQDDAEPIAAFLLQGDDGTQYQVSMPGATGRHPELLLSFAAQAPILSGDYNGNGQVEQGDLDLVLLNWGSDTIPAAWTNNPPEGAVDQQELDAVLLNWGSGAPFGGGSVPEPSGMVLGLLGLTGLLAYSRRSA